MGTTMIGKHPILVRLGLGNEVINIEIEDDGRLIKSFRAGSRTAAGAKVDWRFRDSPGPPVNGSIEYKRQDHRNLLIVKTRAEESQVFSEDRSPASSSLASQIGSMLIDNGSAANYTVLCSA